MANFMQAESIVKYACSCGILNPISKLFFCRHCLKLRCGFCVCHEVDSHFCSNCLENIPSTEARHKKNCCANCFDCPCCQHILTARATTTTVVVPKKTEELAKQSESDGSASATPQSKTYTKKMYYLMCLACRWTSRDAGIPDQTVATGAWPDNECSYQARFNALLEYYQAVVLQDKQEKQEYQRRKAPKSHKYSSLTDRTGLTVSMIRRQIGWADKNTQKAKPVNISPSLAMEDVGLLPDSIFTQKINLRNVTTLKQRHNQPADQPFTVNKLYPQRRFLCIKRSLRCRQCEHNVIKPEYHPTSVKYRIQLFANYHMPDVLLVRPEQALKAGAECSVILKLTNPTMHDMSISIGVLPNSEEELQLIEELKKAVNLKDIPLSASVSASDSLKSLANTPISMTSPATAALSRQVSVNEEPRLVGEIANCDLVTLIEKPFTLNHRDDSTEFDDDEQSKREEPEYITWRKGNKVAIRLKFLPNASLKAGDDVVLGFKIVYSYVNTVSTNTSEKKEPTQHDLNARIYIKIGSITETTA